jgi:aspartate 1-decarboxylase
MIENEKVQVVNINNGERLETYIIKESEALVRYV